MTRGLGDGMGSSPQNYPHGPHVPPSLVLWTCAGAITLGTLVALSQLDIISRKLLNPKTLWEKRRRTQRYRFIKLLQTFNGQVWSKHIEDRTIILDSVDEYDTLLKEVGQPKSNIKLEIVSIVREVKRVNDLQVDGEFALILKKTSDGGGGGGDEEETYYQVPVLEFGLKLAEYMKEEVSTTTFCFVADASGGLSLDMMESIVEVVKQDDPSRGVELLRQPSWMVAFVWFMEDYYSGSVLSKSKLSQLLFGLCRLEAQKFQKCRTLVVTLPTQSTVAPLLPLIQMAFPSERHVFAYGGAASSVSRAVGLFNNKSKKDELPLHQYTCTMLKSSLDRSLLNAPKYKLSLAELPQTHAEALESWICSVDMFFRLKEEEYETKNPDGYLPFTLGLKHLFNSATTDTKNGSMPTKRLALTNLLHYMLGNSAQAKNQADAFDKLLDDCLAALETYEMNEQYVSAEQRTSIEAAVFCHKLILIGDKTLKDTVQPKLKWSLKESKKISGCSCCAPQPGDDDYGDDEYNPIIPTKAAIMEANDNNNNNNSSGGGSMGLFDPNNAGGGLRQRTNAATSTSAAAPTTKNQNQFVDGKMGFAFDPTKFS